MGIGCHRIISCRIDSSEFSLLGLILDNIVVFLYRTISTIIGEYRSRAWHVTTGIVEGTCASENEHYPYAELAYSYTAEGESRSGTYTKGFWFQASANAFASRFPLSSDLVVRYRPGRPSYSFLCECDQCDRITPTPIDDLNTNSSRS